MSSGGTVTFACDGTISLSNEITVSLDAVLDASGHDVVLNGRGSNRLFRITPGRTLTLIHLTLKDGLAAGTNGGPGFAGEAGIGGAILNQGGVLKAIHCSFITNIAQGGRGSIGAFPGKGGDAAGGSVFNDGGEVHLTNTVFQGNLSLGGRGGDMTGIGSGANGGSGFAGAIFSRDGNLVVDHGRFDANASAPGNGGISYLSGGDGDTKGGAIFNTNGTLKLWNSVFSNNRSLGGGFGGQAAGGGIWHAGGQLEATETFFKGNSVAGGNEASQRGSISPAGDGSGGALWMSGSTGALNACSFQGNSAMGGNGGGIRAPFHPGVGRGGAIYTSAPLTVSDTTFFGNTARIGTGSGGGSGLGGALYNDAGAIVLTHVTMVSNVAEIVIPSGTNFFRGGAVDAVNGSTVLRNSILAFGRASTNAFGNITDGGGNISSDATPAFTVPNSRNNLDPQLGTFDNHGGPTPTVSLLPKSPAIDAGSTLWCSSIDQRGYPRTFGSGCDIGAFEFWTSLQLTRLPSGEIQASWPTNQSCVLESMTGFSASDVWTLQTNPMPTLANDQFVFSFSATNSATFFRLRCP